MAQLVQRLVSERRDEEDTEAEDPRETIAKNRKVNAILMHLFFQSVCLTGAGTADMGTFNGIVGNNPARLAEVMSSSISIGGVVEFLLTQLVGKMTDKTGRKPWFLIYPCYCCIGGLAVFLQPKNLNLAWINRVFVWSFAAIFGGIAHSFAALSDVVYGNELAWALARAWSSFGAGMMLGTSLGSQAHAGLGDARYGHLCRALLASIHVPFAYYVLEETLPVEKRNTEPLRLSDANPFKFVKLFTVSRTLSTLVAASTLQACAEGKHTMDIRSLWIAEELAMPVATQSLFMSYWGVLAALGGQLGGQMVAMMGRSPFTTLNNTLTAVGHLLLSIPNNATAWLGYLITTPGFNGNHAAGLKAYCTDHAAEAGIGKGEYTAAMANLRALTAIIVPTLYARLYVSQRLRGKPGRNAWFAVAIIAAIIPELLHQTLSYQELEVKNRKNRRLPSRC